MGCWRGKNLECDGEWLTSKPSPFLWVLCPARICPGAIYTRQTPQVIGALLPKGGLLGGVIEWWRRPFPSGV